MNVDRLRRDIEADEGKRKRIYSDTEGVPTVGIGRNLASVGLSEAEIKFMFDNDLRSSYHAAARVCKSFAFLCDERQEVLVNMAFNLGEKSLGTFKNMLAAIERADFRSAAREMMESKWREQVGQRAVRLARQMETGEHQGMA